MGNQTSAQSELEALFSDMLKKYKGGISNTSTAKFDEIRTFFARMLDIADIEDVYAVGAGTRPGNLEVRFTQGLRATRHTKLGLGFFNADDEKELKKSSDSCLVTVEKFLKKGKASYDAIGIIGVLKGSPIFTRLLETESSTIGAVLTKSFPELVVRTTKPEKAKEVREKGVGKESEIRNLISALHGDLVQANLKVEVDLLKRLMAALMSKPFAILTGLSGSGKTKIAEAVSRWLTAESGQQYKIVAVGADWTSNQNIFGYPDALDPKRYETTPTLDFLIEASRPENEDRPFFLILDEMNMSHVERYFSDFLSAIELGNPIDLYSGPERLGVPRSISLSKNLFVMGTVNVDETTYMFSPKVLDRANVIEFRANAEDLAAVLKNPLRVDMDRVKGKGAHFGKLFLEEILREDGLSQPEKRAASEELLKIFRIMESKGYQFGYRIGVEALRFILFHKRLTSDTWRILDAIDAVCMQKLLPKLHGSRTTMESLIWGLAKFVHAEIADAELDEKLITPMLTMSTSIDPLAFDKDGVPLMKPDDARMMLSFDKLYRMARKVRDGFVSFAEA